MASRRSAQRAVERASRDGFGPMVTGAEPAANPGATGKFGLFGEVLTIGLLMTVVSLAVVTLPIALAAGVRHLRRFTAAEDSRAALFWADVRAGILPSLPIGAAGALIAAVLLLDIELASSGALPGGSLITGACWIGLAALTTGILLVAGEWHPALRQALRQAQDRPQQPSGWRAALRAVPGRVTRDPAGVLYLLATAVFVAVATWALIPLFIPAIGCAALAVVAVPVRRRRTV